jgi:SsrA-binding protein
MSMSNKRSSESDTKARKPGSFNFFNRKAAHRYSLEDKIEAGIQLTGFEIKSLRAGRMSLAEAFVHIRNGEAWLENSYVPPFQVTKNYDPRRPRKLLLHSAQISYFGSKIGASGLTVIPVRVYNRRGLAKVEIALAKGKRKVDKRRAIKEREMKEEVMRALRTEKLSYQKGIGS